VKDGPVRGLVKTLARLVWTGQLLLHRAITRRRGAILWELAGTCERCAKCCDEPAIHVGRVLFSMPLLLRAFVWWQRVVNGFALVREERKEGALVFTCTHFDTTTRQCDSYATRPGMCRDYPRLLLDDREPAFFDGCGYRARAPNADALLASLAAQNIDGDKLVQIKRKLRLE
jgi:uncharacterized protein